MYYFFYFNYFFFCLLIKIIVVVRLNTQIFINFLRRYCFYECSQCNKCNIKNHFTVMLEKPEHNCSAGSKVPMCTYSDGYDIITRIIF